MDRAITVNTTVGQVITWIIIGLLAGLLASVLIRGRGVSLSGSLMIGLIGAVVGGFLFNLLEIEPTGPLSGELVIEWIDIVAAIVGAVLVPMAVGTLFRRRI
mgnify:FL=1